jgi:hypothetical protein
MLHHALLTLLVTTSQPVVDSDVDGIPDAAENLLQIEPDGDHDSDGVANCVDPDDRGDGRPGDCVPSYEADICLRPSFEFDWDGDQVPNHLDLESDDDGYLDSEEGMVDTDSDQIPDFLDVNSDGDGFPDIDDLCRLVPDTGRDSDNDGIGDACSDSLGHVPDAANPNPADGSEPSDDEIEPGDDDDIDNLAGGVGGCNAGGRSGASWLVLGAIGALIIRRRRAA